LGYFTPDNTTPRAAYGSNAPKAQEIFNAVGWP